MAKESGVEIDGTVVEALSNGFFKVAIDQQSAPNAQPIQITAHIGGKMRTRFIRVVEGDKVRVELSPYDLTRGRITWLLSRRRPAPGSDPEAAGAAPVGPPVRGGR